MSETFSSGSYNYSTGSGSGNISINTSSGKNKVSLREMLVINLFKGDREKKTFGLKR